LSCTAGPGCGKGRSNKITHIITVTFVTKHGDFPAVILHDEKGTGRHDEERRGHITVHHFQVLKWVGIANFREAKGRGLGTPSRSYNVM
jgi:hypothetical protein